MKTMTCKQLGGPCNVEHHGKDHNEIIKAQDRHLKVQVAAGDETHRKAPEAMRGRWKRPISGLGWYRDVKREFAGLPDDAQAGPVRLVARWARGCARSGLSFEEEAKARPIGHGDRTRQRTRLTTISSASERTTTSPRAVR